jgi:hypothetical protein
MSGIARGTSTISIGTSRNGETGGIADPTMDSNVRASGGSRVRSPEVLPNTSMKGELR